MYRSSFLLVAAAVLRAAPITSVGCTLGNVTITSTSSCSLPFVVQGVGSGTVDAMASVDESVTGLTASANGGATMDPGVFWGISATAKDTAYYATDGPKRPGYIGLNVGGFGGESMARVGPFTQGTNGVFPFELGPTFVAAVSASTAAGAEGALANDSIAFADFLLYEADRVTLVPVSFSTVPEPWSGALLLAGLGVCALFSHKRRWRSRIDGTGLGSNRSVLLRLF